MYFSSKEKMEGKINMNRFTKKIIFAVLELIISTCIFIVGFTADWTQLQFDAQRTGRTTDSVTPPFRMRWVWFGPTVTIRNHLSNSSWTGPDLFPGEILANKATLPTSVPCTFASGVQPIVANNKVFVADMDGKVYAINADDGSTLWQSDNPGGTVASCAYANNVVVVCSVTGKIRGYNATTGTQLWEVSTKGAITSAPVTNGQVVCVGNSNRRVYCVNITNGTIIWISSDLGAQVGGGLAMDETSVYVGAENMYFYALNISDGNIRKSVKVQGQSFYLEWPVVFSSYVFIRTAPIPCVGSEYVGEEVMNSATNIDDEQNRWLQWLSGQGGYTDASVDWKCFTVLNKTDFSEPFNTPFAVPYEGCGTPPEPPVIDNQGRVLSYYKTRYTKFAKSAAFGTNYTIDISAIDLTTGRRIVIDNGRLADNETYTWETDNLYGLCVGGNILYLRQNFRGTVCIDLQTSSATLVTAHYSWEDGGGFPADFIYCGDTREQGQRLPSVSTRSWAGRVSPAVSGNVIYITETFGVAAIEHHQ